MLTFTTLLIKRAMASQKKMSVSEEMKYIDSFPYPKNDFQRAYFQYKAIFVNVNPVFHIILNLLAIPVIPFFLILYTRNSFKREEKSVCRALLVHANNKYGMEYDYTGIFPYGEAQKRYGAVHEILIKKYPDLWNGRMGKTALLWWIRLCVRCPFLFYFQLTCLVQLMNMNRLIFVFHPQAIFNARVEENYTSSIITGFCENMGVSYELFMHGELWRCKNLAFVRFSKIYVWDEYYTELFERLSAHADEYVIYFPKMLCIKKDDPATRIGMTYYLSNEKKIGQVIEILIKIKNRGIPVKIRPHPRWTNIQDLQNLLAESAIEIEDTKNVPITQSISSAKYIVGMGTTVLYQAYMNGYAVVINDVSDTNQFQELVAADYILLRKGCMLLSDFIKRELKLNE